MKLKGKAVLITGGTGSLGKILTRRILTGEIGTPRKIIIFSRDEAKQHEMRLEYMQRAVVTDEVIYRNSSERVEFRIGDVRDYHSVSSAVKDADFVFNAAALKQVPSCEYFPFEAVQTNVIGPENMAILRGTGINNALINIGGNVMALGSKGDQPWRVGIQRPRSPSPLATLDLQDGEAVGTSGDYQRFFEIDGRRYAHLLDPRTGAPAEGTRAVTVLIPPGPKAGMRSDAASKPLFIAGPDWRPLAERMGVAHVLRIDAAGRVETTPALAERLRFEDRSPA